MKDSESTQDRTVVYVCLNDDCCKRGSQTIYDELKAEAADLEHVEVREYICFGNCDFGANTVVLPDRVWFSGLRQGDSPVVLQYLREGVASPAHTGKVEEELAETTWELLELDMEEEADDLEPAHKNASGR